VVLTLETYLRSVFGDEVPPSGQWWTTLLYEAPEITSTSSDTKTIQFLFDGQSATGGFHRLLLHAVCQYHGLVAVSQSIDKHRALVVSGSHSAPDTLLAQLIDDADQLPLLEEPWTLIEEDNDEDTANANEAPATANEIDHCKEANAKVDKHALAPDFLTPEQIITFQRDGVLVVDGFLSDAQLQNAREGLATTLRRHGVDPDNLAATGRGLASLSTTGGSGGVLDVFYEDWQLDITMDAQLLTWTQQLWKSMYLNRDDTSWQDLPEGQRHQWHPYGTWDPTKAYAYLDRICYRLPTTLSQELGIKQTENKTSHSLSAKQKKKCALQRSLTPHLDCCPDTYDTVDGKTKWRPIQCFVSLTDNTEPSTGGFEVAPGFHHDFRTWTQQRIPTKSRDGNLVTPPCIGEYTHIRPVEDVDVMKRIQHVPVRAGSVVFWDNRLPHANAYRHNGSIPRAVVYCSFLPGIALNERYARHQLERWLHGRTPNDQWIQEGDSSKRDGTKSTGLRARLAKLPELQRKLLAVEDW
jgi:hypothetical protein